MRMYIKYKNNLLKLCKLDAEKIINNMKLKIKVKVLTRGCMPSIVDNGEWIDLMSAINIDLKANQSGVLRKNSNGVAQRDVTMYTHYIPLGVAMQLPKGFEAVVNSRSSGPKKMGLLIPNGQGVIDNSYSGNSDEWMYVCSAMRPTHISRGDRICQFRIQLSQKATIWQKLIWLFSSGIELIEVDNLSNNSRGGFGSTGIN